MTLRSLLTAGAASVVLVACGQPQTAANATDAGPDSAALVPVSAEAETPSMADVAGGQTTAEAPPPEPEPAPASFAGEYEGPFAEGGTGYVTLTGSGPSYQAEVVVTTPDGCSGQLRGTARASGDTLTLRDGACTITMNQTGQSLVVSEDDCSEWRGMGCRFDGTARRMQ